MTPTGTGDSYRDVLDSSNEDDPAWGTAVCEYANSLLADPNAAPEAFQRAFALLDALIARLRSSPLHGSHDREMLAGALREALRVRTPEADPIGRARTLRALAFAIPEWTGAESQAHAHALAAEFRQAADAIAQSDPRAAPASISAGAFAGERSALYEDLDKFLQLPDAQAWRALDAFIAHHRSVIETIDAASMPTPWAEWCAGAAGAIR